MDRLTVMKMIMKMADISTPTKSFELHRAWTKLITEEFFQQVPQIGTLYIVHDWHLSCVGVLVPLESFVCVLWASKSMGDQA